MSHSTHVGFNCPLTTFTPWLCRPSHRFAVGVGNARPVPPSPRTASVSEIPGCAFELAVFLEPAAFASPLVGVGHRPVWAIVSRLAMLRLSVLFPVPLPLLPYSSRLGVG